MFNCDKVYLDNCKYGKGVFARTDIKKGSIIEKGIVAPYDNIDGENIPHLLHWSDDKKTWGIATGLIMWYNHSDNPNAKKMGDLKNNTLEVVALTDIKKGDEIFTKYMSAKWRKCFKNLGN